jgi:ketosteroid isomerase-like protein
MNSSKKSNGGRNKRKNFKIKFDGNKVTDQEDNFEFKYIRIDGNVAYAVYNLRSDITKEGKLTQKNWDESTIFRKVNGEWKNALIHSTPVKNNSEHYYAALLRFAFSTKSPKYSVNLSSPVDFLLASKVQ